MANETFKALVVREAGDGTFTGMVEDKAFSALPDNDVLIHVEYSSFNVKDALSATGVKRVTTQFPHTPGIDAAGTVKQSKDPRFAPGDEVLVTGYDLGMNTSGGYGEYISVPGDWVVKRHGLNARDAMIYGTAGFTAGMSVDAIVRHGTTPEHGPVLVSGATGGVGSITVSILASLGFEVVAVCNKPEMHETLKALGASRFITRDEADDTSGKIMLEEKWGAVVDIVGGNILATSIKSVRSHGIVTMCGWLAGDHFDSTIYPFMVRGVTLAGIDSVTCPMDVRQRVWNKLANEWRTDLSSLVKEVTLDGVMELVQPILKGKLSGRTIVKCEA